MTKLDTTGYNATDLDPLAVFERHVFHRDQFAHYLRWTHVLKVVKAGEVVVDFGCGRGNLLEVLYRNRFAPERYVGFDIRASTVKQAQEKWSGVKFRTDFHAVDLVKTAPEMFSQLNADRVCSFEVVEHVGKSNVQPFLRNFRACGRDDARYYLSTPNFDERVGAAGNHTYDADDGMGVQPQEWEHEALRSEIELAGFKVVDRFGTFASQRDYLPHLTGGQREVWDQLKRYYDSNLVSVIMAPIIDAALARNCLWVLERK